MAFTGIIRKNFWGLLSILITLGSAVLILTIVRYFYWRGLWAASPGIENLLSWWGDMAILLSMVTAAVGLAKDESRRYSISALFLSLLSVMFYVR